ncbi:hypothetical protein QT06_C0001G0757 [archaeon GW2011_AR15]|nr:hypothetical protein QT06_C0001G0757 [archaeon GW2011_AR15]MBS3103462.1 hypothetical protein [Candidatus Woesearchaeota archaeon]
MPITKKSQLVPGGMYRAISPAEFFIEVYDSISNRLSAIVSNLFDQYKIFMKGSENHNVREEIIDLLFVGDYEEAKELLKTEIQDKRLAEYMGLPKLKEIFDNKLMETAVPMLISEGDVSTLYDEFRRDEARKLMEKLTPKIAQEYGVSHEIAMKALEISLNVDDGIGDSHGRATEFLYQNTEKMPENPSLLPQFPYSEYDAVIKSRILDELENSLGIDEDGNIGDVPQSQRKFSITSGYNSYDNHSPLKRGKMYAAYRPEQINDIGLETRINNGNGHNSEPRKGRIERVEGDVLLIPLVSRAEKYFSLISSPEEKIIAGMPYETAKQFYMLVCEGKIEEAYNLFVRESSIQIKPEHVQREYEDYKNFFNGENPHVSEALQLHEEDVPLYSAIDLGIVEMSVLRIARAEASVNGSIKPVNMVSNQKVKIHLGKIEAVYIVHQGPITEEYSAKIAEFLAQPSLV